MPAHQPSNELLAAALAEERDLLVAVMENSPEASLVYLDRDFNFVLVNSTYAAACGTTREHLIGRNHFEMFPNAENEEIFRRARDTKQPMEFRAKPFVFEDQPWRGVTYWDWTLTPLVDADAEVRGFVFSLVDVTERERRQQLSDSLSALDVIIHSTLDIEETLERVTADAARAVGCESAGIVFRDGDRWRAEYLDPILQESAGGRWFSAEEVPVAEAAAAMRAVVAIDDVAAAEPHIRASLEPFGVKSILNVPLFVGGEVVGALGLHYHTEPIGFAAPVVEFATRVGTSLSLALSNARLYEQQRGAGFYSDALNRTLTAFISTLDPDEILERVVEESAAAVGADYSVISVVEDGQWVVKNHFGSGGEVRVGVRDPYLERPVIVSAAESCEIQLVSDAMADPRTNKAIMRAFDVGAFAAVPLLLRGSAIGVLELVYDERTTFDEARIVFLGKLMVTASLALEQARAFEHEHRVADTLQEALIVLPERVPGIEFAHSYQSASDLSRVGGDFYDLFELDHGLIGITVGDISGKGLDAAVLTSLVKNTIRAKATEKGTTPADALRLANTVLYRGSDPATFVTVFFGILDSRDGRMVYCNAGHTAAAVVRGSGEVGVLPSNSALAGAFLDVEFTDSVVVLSPDDQLFLYTDGLIEARSDGVQYGEERLLGLLAELAGATSADTVRRAVEAAVAFAGARLSDDVAVLALRWTGAQSAVSGQQKLHLG
ncbi:MAG: SpoIIE family protein phosphatase [Coriobacteriia bacterium]|nr:SpoIIE family protein phosphatase [Coriobacteriia bacterium]